MQRPDLRARIDAAVRAIRTRCPLAPRVGITLGTGLGGLAREVDVEARIPYREIPHFHEPRVASHAGSLALGRLGGVPVALLEGRHHIYEGLDADDVTFPVRVLRALGAELAILSNAAGGLDPNMRRGDILIIEDHINLMGIHPLTGPNDDALGPRFPDMSEPYDLGLVARLEDIALEEGIRARRGVYAALVGPCLETRAEYRMLRVLGADAVGMSTVPEVIVAVHAGLRVAGLSCITDLCNPEALQPVRIEEILRVAEEAEPRLARLCSRLVASLEAPEGEPVR